MTHRPRHILRVLFLAVVLLCACTRRTPVEEPVMDRATPRWTRVRPNDSRFYHGVGYTPQSLNAAADQTGALENARLDLLMDIQSGLKPGLATDEVTSALWPRIDWTDFARELEVLTPKDTFADEIKHRAWAYLTIDREELDRILARRKESLEARARRHLEDARKAAQDGDLVDALEDGLAGLSRSAGPEGIQMPGSRPGSLLRLEVEQALTAMMQDVQLRRVAGLEHSPSSGLKNAQVVVQVIGRNDGQPLADLPLAFRFARGSGVMNPATSTDSQGIGRGVVKSLDPKITPVEIEVVPDPQGLLAAARLPALSDEALSFLVLPSLSFSVTLEAPRLLLTHIERGGNGGNRSALVLAELVEAFRNKGLTVKDASVEMLVNPEVFYKVEQGQDPGDLMETDLVGVFLVNLTGIRKEKGRYQDVLYGMGEALFRLYDLERNVLRMDIRLPQEVTGFSQMDVERNFFLQATDEMRDRVLGELANDAAVRPAR